MKKTVCDMCGDECEPLARFSNNDFWFKVECSTYETRQVMDHQGTGFTSEEVSRDACKECTFRAIAASWLTVDEKAKGKED